jgi:molecular chaperone DnaK
MVKEAEANAAADKARKDLVEAQNAADSLIHSTEKALAEHGDKVGADEKTAIETGLADLKTAREGTDPEDIRAKTNTLVQASMKLGEAMYAQQQGSGDAAEGQPADDGVVDAEFEEVSDADNADDKKSA